MDDCRLKYLTAEERWGTQREIGHLRERAWTEYIGSFEFKEKTFHDSTQP